jgi:hypothetical protein
MPERDAFASHIPFNVERVGAAAVYCSDGRYGDQMDDFLHHGRGWPRYDRVALPGGPAVWSGQLAVLWDEYTLKKYLEFLVRSHQLTQLALIGHENCGFYRHWLNVPAEQIEQRQHDDLRSARQRIGQALPGLAVHTFFARRKGDGVHFDVVE